MVSFLFQSLSLKQQKRFYYISLSTLCLGLSGCTLSFLAFNKTRINNTTQLANYNLNLGLAYLKAGDTVQAKAKLLAAERKQPDSAHIKSAIAYFLAQIGEWEKAENYHLASLKKEPSNGAIHNNYGCFLCQRGQYQKAETHFLKAAQQFHYTNTAKAYENAGLCAMYFHHLDKAVQYLTLALQHDHRLEKACLALAKLYQAKKPAVAYEYLKSYYSLVSQSSPEALNLGIALANDLNDSEAAHRYALALQK